MSDRKTLGGPEAQALPAHARVVDADGIGFARKSAVRKKIRREKTSAAQFVLGVIGGTHPDIERAVQAEPRGDRRKAAGQFKPLRGAGAVRTAKAALAKLAERHPQKRELRRTARRALGQRQQASNAGLRVIARISRRKTVN